MRSSLASDFAAAYTAAIKYAAEKQMSTTEGLRKSAIASPEDKLPSLVYLDHLDEIGHPAATFLRHRLHDLTQSPHTDSEDENGKHIEYRAFAAAGLPYPHIVHGSPDVSTIEHHVGEGNHGLSTQHPETKHFFEALNYVFPWQSNSQSWSIEMSVPERLRWLEPGEPIPQQREAVRSWLEHVESRLLTRLRPSSRENRETPVRIDAWVKSRVSESTNSKKGIRRQQSGSMEVSDHDIRRYPLVHVEGKESNRRLHLYASQTAADRDGVEVRPLSEVLEELRSEAERRRAAELDSLQAQRISGEVGLRKVREMLSQI